MKAAAPDLLGEVMSCDTMAAHDDAIDLAKEIVRRFMKGVVLSGFMRGMPPGRWARVLKLAIDAVARENGT